MDNRKRRIINMSIHFQKRKAGEKNVSPQVRHSPPDALCAAGVSETYPDDKEEGKAVLHYLTINALIGELVSIVRDLLLWAGAFPFSGRRPYER